MEEDYNPFTDPAILEHQAAGTGNPARATTTGSSYSSYVVGNNEPAAQYVLPTQQTTKTASASPPPPYSANAKPLTSEELLRQQEVLEKKAAELERKEREIRQREAAAGIRPNNFPPLPSFVPIQPCFYQDFDVDIAQEFRQTVKLIYYIYLAFALILVINLFACIVYVISGGDSGGSQLICGILILGLGVPCGYACWMRAVYNAFKKDSSLSFFLFFFSFFLKICLLVVLAIGPQGYGVCGWLVVFNMFSDEEYFAAIVSLVVAVSLTALCAAMVIMLQKVHSFYRRSDASFEKAQSEFMTNRHVEGAARNVARNAATAAANNP